MSLVTGLCGFGISPKHDRGDAERREEAHRAGVPVPVIASCCRCVRSCSRRIISIGPSDCGRQRLHSSTGSMGDEIHS